MLENWFIMPIIKFHLTIVNQTIITEKVLILKLYLQTLFKVVNLKIIRNFIIYSQQPNSQFYPLEWLEAYIHLLVFGHETVGYRNYHPFLFRLWPEAL